MTVVTGGTSVTSGASGSAGSPAGLARSWRRDAASHNRPSDIRPVDGLEEGIDERLLRDSPNESAASACVTTSSGRTIPRRVDVP